jgi:hypothetical protein
MQIVRTGSDQGGIVFIKTNILYFLWGNPVTGNMRGAGFGPAYGANSFHSQSAIMYDNN